MVLTLGAAYFLLKPARYAIVLWGPVIAGRRLPGIGDVGATATPVAFGVAGVAAPVLVGWISDTLLHSRRVPPRVVALGLLTGVTALSTPLTATGPAVYAADSMISCVAAVVLGAEDDAGTATGLVNGCGTVGAVLGGLLPGSLSAEVLFHGFAGAAPGFRRCRTGTAARAPAAAPSVTA